MYEYVCILGILYISPILILILMRKQVQGSFVTCWILHCKAVARLGIEATSA